ncbi:hypothetical protein EWM64_g4502 [Hericium alpestre]|uniref:Uncharacterized protein n=1 Tax=Hericium alpestre TaxID=135208 RepID=A0A4Y9ZZL6_9AGAM|nr:hypothetical protein EWM64_g4502 [Hericium alpestre]
MLNKAAAKAENHYLQFAVQWSSIGILVHVRLFTLIVDIYWQLYFTTTTP